MNTSSGSPSIVTNPKPLGWLSNTPVICEASGFIYFPFLVIVSFPSDTRLSSTRSSSRLSSLATLRKIASSFIFIGTYNSSLTNSTIIFFLCPNNSSIYFPSVRFINFHTSEKKASTHIIKVYMNAYFNVMAKDTYLSAICLKYIKN